jgi:hypothetical protein
VLDGGADVDVKGGARDEDFALNVVARLHRPLDRVVADVEGGVKGLHELLLGDESGGFKDERVRMRSKDGQAVGAGLSKR